MILPTGSWLWRRVRVRCARTPTRFGQGNLGGEYRIAFKTEDPAKFRLAQKSRMFVARLNEPTMDEFQAKIVMLSRHELASRSQALEMTADMIEDNFSKDDEPASPLILRAIAQRGPLQAAPGRTPRFRQPSG
jgi:hypothetical protein